MLSRCWRQDSRDISFFFLQAEAGIRDKLVTGVQTCALPIYEFPAGLSVRPNLTASRPSCGNAGHFRGRQGALKTGEKTAIYQLFLKLAVTLLLVVPAAGFADR